MLFCLNHADFPAQKKYGMKLGVAYPFSFFLPPHILAMARIDEDPLFSTVLLSFLEAILT